MLITTTITTTILSLLLLLTYLIACISVPGGHVRQPRGGRRLSLLLRDHRAGLHVLPRLPRAQLQNRRRAGYY